MEIREDSKKAIVLINELGKEPELGRYLLEIFYQVEHGDIHFHTILDFQASLAAYGIANLTFITLLSLRKELKARELKLVLCSLSSEMKRALSDYGVEELFVVVESEDEALKALGINP